MKKKHKVLKIIFNKNLPIKIAVVIVLGVVVIIFLSSWYLHKSSMSAEYAKKLYSAIGVTKGFVKDEARSSDDKDSLANLYSQHIYVGNRSAREVLDDMERRLKSIGFSEITRSQIYGQEAGMPKLLTASCREGGVHVGIISNTTDPETVFRIDIFEGYSAKLPACPKL